MSIILEQARHDITIEQYRQLVINEIEQPHILLSGNVLPPQDIFIKLMGKFRILTEVSQKKVAKLLMHKKSKLV